jgi:hypothetical protein
MTLYALMSQHILDYFGFILELVGLVTEKKEYTSGVGLFLLLSFICSQIINVTYVRSYFTQVVD